MTLQRRIVLAGLAAWVLIMGAWRQTHQASVAPLTFITRPVQAISSVALTEISRYDIPMPANTPAAHASFLLSDPDGGLRAFWFAGSRESGPDVQIVASAFLKGQWTQPRTVVNRHRVFAQLGAGGWIRRLGNPVAWIDAQGRTHMYVVATGLGGWAASRILHLVQAKQDVASQPIFIPQGFLQLSPFFNFSHLVRGAPVGLADGGVLLPAYFEFGIKYPVALRLDAAGELVQSRDAVVRMAGNLKSLQPTVVVASSSNATAYLRDNSADQQLRFVQTLDSGKHWQDVKSVLADTNSEIAGQRASGQVAANQTRADLVINPDSSPTAISVFGQTLLIHNPQTSGRHRLVIDGSGDGLLGFKRLATLEYEPEKLDDVEFNEYSYPSAVVMGDLLHVSYTYQKRFIRHVVLKIERKEAIK